MENEGRQDRRGPPRLEVLDPSGRHFTTVVLDRPDLVVGRSTSEAPVGLTLPDPGAFVSRRHCHFVGRGGQWWVVDDESRNGTFVRRSGRLSRVEKPARLVHGDAVCLMAGAAGGERPHYWQLCFVDPDRTRAAAIAPDETRGPCLRYDFGEARLYLQRSDGVVEIPLRPHEHRLVRYMAQQNVESGASVLCTYDELIVAVWGEHRPAHRQDEVSSLVFHLRRKLTTLTTEPLIENERTLGYRLITCI